MTQKITLRNRLQYAFDKTMSKGAPALIAWLGILSVLLVIVIAGVAVAFRITPEGEVSLGFTESAWQSLMRTLDPGTMGGDLGWGFRLLMLCVTIGGIFIVSTLIGVLSSGIESRLDELRKGRSFVIEKNHTLILGWSSKIFTIISELVIANENQRKPRIVILADKDKVEMEDEIREKVGDLRNTRVICRRGIPEDIRDLNIVNPLESKSIIILSPPVGDADAQTIKMILAVTNNPGRRTEPYNIVAEIKDERFLEIARLVGKEDLAVLLTDDVIARIMVQTCRQSGLSVVYTMLLGFEGSEIYFQEDSSLTGKTYHEALGWYEDSAVIGMKTAGGQIFINPPMDMIFSSGDAVMAITEDDDTLIMRKEKGPVAPEKISVGNSRETATEKTLILGWNHRGKRIIRELNAYLQMGSEIMIVTEGDIDDAELREMASSYSNLTIAYRKADTTDKAAIASLHPETYDHIVVLSYIDDYEIQQADAKTLITLLLLRHLAEEHNVDMSIVSEMMDIQNRELAAVTKADDFIVSDKLISMLVAQISENKSLMDVYSHLFRDEGAEIYLKPAGDYIETGVPVNFFTVVESASRRGETAFGYALAAEALAPEKAYGIKINPFKSIPVTFSPQDRIIVMAEN